jgi:hypothetical protein
MSLPEQKLRGSPLIRLFVLLALALSVNAAAQVAKTHGPDCSGGWPTNTTQGFLKNDGQLKNEDFDFSKTTTIRLASERLNKDLWRQVYLVTFFKHSGESIQAVVMHDASAEECSMTGVQVFVVSKRIDGRP